MALPQAPQARLVVERFTHAPEQFVCPAEHLQAPPAQTWVAVQAAPQPPQLL
jgi:hypothetical protein